jgi:hypothetical protein
VRQRVAAPPPAAPEARFQARRYHPRVRLRSFRLPLSGHRRERPRKAALLCPPVSRFG